LNAVAPTVPAAASSGHRPRRVSNSVAMSRPLAGQKAMTLSALGAAARASSASA
jgi:hypothetical protein